MIQALILTSNGGASHKSVCNMRLVCRQKLAQDPAVSLSSSESEQLSSSACLEWDALHSANCHSPAELSPEKLVHPFDEGNMIQNEMARLCETIMPSDDIERVSTIYHPHCPTWAYTIIHPHLVVGRSHKTACKIRLVCRQKLAQDPALSPSSSKVWNGMHCAEIFGDFFFWLFFVGFAVWKSFF